MFNSKPIIGDVFDHFETCTVYLVGKMFKCTDGFVMKKHDIYQSRSAF